MSSHYQKAYFLLSVANMEQLPPDSGIEVAIVGRSNSGKSSILNKLTQNRGLARVSKTPGRTQLVNVFELDDHRRIIDLPGYGFAKVPLAVKLNWQKTVDEYIETRESLRGLVMIMDIRHPLKDLDIQLLEYCDDRGLPVHIVLNKSDKLSKGVVAKTLLEVEQALKDFRNEISFQTSSVLKNLGIKELQQQLHQWYNF